nr:hypothetical protein [Tanacetum cinerariifolium]
MPKSINDKKENQSPKRTTRISVRTCCLINPPSNSPPYHRYFHPSDYQMKPPSTPLDSPLQTPIASLGFSSSELLTTPKTTPPPLTFPPSAATQASKQSSSFTLNIKPIEIIFFTPPISPHPFFDSLKYLPPRTTNPPPPKPSFDLIERLANQPP